MAAPTAGHGGVLAPLSHWRPNQAASDGAMQRAIRSVVYPCARITHRAPAPSVERKRRPSCFHQRARFEGEARRGAGACPRAAAIHPLCRGRHLAARDWPKFITRLAGPCRDRPSMVCGTGETPLRAADRPPKAQTPLCTARFRVLWPWAFPPQPGPRSSVRLGKISLASTRRAFHPQIPTRQRPQRRREGRRRIRQRMIAVAAPGCPGGVIPLARGARVPPASCRAGRRTVHDAGSSR